MNTDIYVWTDGVRWLCGAFFIAVDIWAIVVVKRAIVGKSKWFHWERILHHRT